MKKITLLGWILPAIYVIVVLWIIYALRPTSTIFTCTTFFDFEKQDKWAAFCKAMDSIQELHTPATLGKIDKWFIVNEYASNHKRDWAKAVHEKYPFIELYQKGPEEKGQASSMNVILQKIKGYTYWIHWEETWYCRSSCIDRMFDVIRSTSITQLQVTQHKEKPNWLDSDSHPNTLHITHSGTKYYRIYPSPNTELYMQKTVYEYDTSFISKWPLYSLLPSINRVSDYTLGDFSTDPVLWPIKFEWDYGRRWLLAGNTKAVLPDGPVIRDNSIHKSTYS
jgi:hypothetical protein